MKLTTIVLIALIFLSLVIYVVFSDKESTPLTKVNAMNQTEIYCNPGDQMQQSEKNASKTICFNSSPLGHTILTTPQLFWLLYIITIGGVITFQYWREFLSSKIFCFENKYQDTLHPISKHSDVFKQNGYLRVRSGYDSYFTEKKNEFYIAKEGMYEQIGKHVIFLGSIKKVTAQTLYLYLRNDIKLMREILEDDNIQASKGKIINPNISYKIFIPVPIPQKKLVQFLSIKGHYSMSADRFSTIITMLFKMRRNLRHASPKLSRANKGMLDDAKDIAAGTANIAFQYGQTREYDLTSQKTIQEPVTKENKP